MIAMSMGPLQLIDSRVPHVDAEILCAVSFIPYELLPISRTAQSYCILSGKMANSCLVREWQAMLVMGRDTLHDCRSMAVRSSRCSTCLARVPANARRSLQGIIGTLLCLL